MKRGIIATIVIVFLIGALLCFTAAERYWNAVYWIEEGAFGKAASYVDEVPFIIELFDPGFVSYVYAAEAMGYGRYEEAIELLKPLAEKDYRDTIQMLEYCIEQVNKSQD